MSLEFDQKEDLRLRMADLEKKLAESEDERHKLEKTCNVLIRAFREEEKIHYKTLNEKYEKFLEDCSVRRRRNDIILRSLCRIEDRARAVFAKTERLKLLKDYYIPHLKLQEFKKDGLNSLGWKTLPEKRTISDEITNKTVHWETARTSDFSWNNKTTEYPRTGENPFLLSKGYEKFDAISYGMSTETLYKTKPEKNIWELRQHFSKLSDNEYDYSRVTANEIKENQRIDDNLLSGISVRQEFRKSPDNIDKLNAIDVATNNYESQINQNPSYVNNYGKEVINENKNAVDSSKKVIDLDSSSNSTEKTGYSVVIAPQNRDLKEVSELREKGVIKHQESIEKLKKALSIEEESEDEKKDSDKFFVQDDPLLEQELVGKEETEKNEKNKDVLKRSDVTVPSTAERDNFNQANLLTPTLENNSTPQFSVEENNSVNKGKENESDFRVENFDQEDNNCGDDLPKDFESFPMGLDGVDYQNETYPESYYEQPVHQHNYSSLASDVILEEDESEQDLDEPEGENNPYQTGSLNKTQTEQNMFYTDKTNHSNPGLDTLFQSSGGHDPNEPFDSQNHQLQETAPDVFNKPNGSIFNGNLQETSEKSCNEEGDSRDSDSETNLQKEIPDESSILSDKPKSEMLTDRSNKGAKAQVTQSNLIHLLESDSESFQIEHGDKVSVNDDSDFDFSFHQN